MTKATRVIVAGLVGLSTVAAAPTAGRAEVPDPGEELPVSSCTSPKTLESKYVPSRQATLRLRYSAGCQQYWANATLDSYSNIAPAGCDGIEIRIKVQSGESGPHGVVLQAERVKSDVSAGCGGSSTIVIATAGVSRFTSRIIGRACVGVYEGVPITNWTCTNWHNAA